MGDHASEIRQSELRLGEIKNDIDQFEQKFRRITGGLGTVTELNEAYHNVIVSTKDLSSHLVVLQRATNAGTLDAALRARAHNLNRQASVQLTRIRQLGRDVQRFVTGGHTGGVASKTSPSRLSQIINEDPLSAPQQKQQQLQPPQQVDERYAESMERLESDIVQVNELFTTLASYVHDQGDMIDSIGNNIEVAYEKVESGNTHLHAASKHRTSVRRKKFICFILLLIVLFVAILVIIFSVKN